MEGNDTAYSPGKKELSRGAPALQEKTAPGTITLGLRQQKNLKRQQSAAVGLRFAPPLRLSPVGCLGVPERGNNYDCCGTNFISSLQFTAAAYLRSISRDGE